MDNQLNIFEKQLPNVFNTPIEVGFRALYILNAIEPASIDIERIAIYDYFLLNSKDILISAPTSLHPAIPYRSLGFIIKPIILKKALILMISKGLIDVLYNHQGIEYRANELTKNFIQIQTNKYASLLLEHSKWVVNNFQDYSNQELSDLMKQNIKNGGQEFIYESLIRL